ncbi:MAG: AsmA family protein, partial [Bacteroidales bacterium]
MKYIKKILKIFAVLCLVIISLSFILYGFLQSSKVQTYIINYAASKITKITNTPVHIGKVNLFFWNRFSFEDVFIGDDRGDTLVFAKKMKVHISLFDLPTQKFTVRRLSFDEAYFNILMDSSNNDNVSFLANLFDADTTNDTIPQSWNISVKQFVLTKSRFRYQNFYKQQQWGKGEVNFDDLRLQDIDLNISNIQLYDDSVSMQINELFLREYTGICIKQLNAKASFGKNFFNFRNVYVRVEKSVIKALELKFEFEDLKSLKYFTTKVKLNYKFESAIVNLGDIRYFSNIFEGAKNKVTLIGELTGTVKDFKGKNIELFFDTATRLYGNFDITGLPVLDNTFFHFEIEKLVTNYNDLCKIQSYPFTDSINIYVSPYINNLGNLTYKGYFTGFYNDFVAYGKLRTDFGTIETDLKISLNQQNDAISLAGLLNTNTLNIGKIFETSELGTLTMNTVLNGEYNTSDSFMFSIQGNVKQLEFHNYNYSQIIIAGEVSEKEYVGTILINDENLIA